MTTTVEGWTDLLDAIKAAEATHGAHGWPKIKEAIEWGSLHAKGYDGHVIVDLNPKWIGYTAKFLSSDAPPPAAGIIGPEKPASDGKPVTLPPRTQLPVTDKPELWDQHGAVLLFDRPEAYRDKGIVCPARLERIAVNSVELAKLFPPISTTQAAAPAQSPQITSTATLRPKRGPRALKMKSVAEAMRAGIKDGTRPAAVLGAMLEKTMAKTFGANRETCRKARKAVHVGNRQQRIATNSRLTTNCDTRTGTVSREQLNHGVVRKCRPVPLSLLLRPSSPLRFRSARRCKRPAARSAAPSCTKHSHAAPCPPERAARAP